MNSEEIKKRVLERVMTPYPKNCHLVPYSTPVVSFGNPETSTVATLGINPSSGEFFDKKKNLFVWFIDQMQHSGRFWNTELCMRACAIADRAIENEYDHYKSVQIYEDLFEVK
jgi:hypothetical protein